MEPIKDLITNRTNIPFLKRVLDLSSFKQKLIASNIASVSTPGYQSKDMNFKKELGFVLNKAKTPDGRTNSAHIRLGKSKERTPEVLNSETVNPNNINTVDIDKEAVDLTDNELMYKFGTKFMSRNFSLLKMSIKGE